MDIAKTFILRYNICMFDLIVIGGGAAGIFAAIQAKESYPESSVLVLEKTATLLAKVRVSGGGRCNVTHSCFDPKQLVNNYPRGSKELLGPFHRFQPQDTIRWFTERGVALKTEADGRMFPTTDSSQTIINCLLNEAKRLGVEIRLGQKIERITKADHFCLHLKDGATLESYNLLLATGGNKDGHEFAHSLGHTIVPPVPSLFTLHSPTSPLNVLSGIAVQDVAIELEGHKQRGPLLITHFGFSGPAVLKLSAWAARTLFDRNYRAELKINWLPQLTEEEIYEKLVEGDHIYLPKKLYQALTSDKNLRKVAQKLHADVYQIDGKTMHKEEFVTCGGVSLKEINFKTMESRHCPGLFFAGEILDIDGVTGGFNFQNGWTTGFIAGSSLQCRRSPQGHQEEGGPLELSGELV